VEVVNIPISKLVKDPMNMRKDPEDVSELVEEIRKHGWTVPLEVRPLKNGSYGIVCGSRRLHAARVLGLESIPCIVAEMDDDEAMRRSMADNELHKELTEEERVAYYKLMVEKAGSINAAARKYRIPKETMRQALEEANLADLLNADGEEGSKGLGNSQKTHPPPSAPPSEKPKLKKRDIVKLAKDIIKKKAGDKNTKNEPYWKVDTEFLKEVKKEVQEKLEKISSKLWEPAVFKRKPDGPALHEVLQKPTILEFVPVEPWPLGWKPAPVQNGPLKTLVPVYGLGGDFSNIAVLLCPKCGHVLRGLGKGIPVVCLNCGFPSSDEFEWKKV